MKQPNKKGFSLIEVIIAFSILTITVLASTQLISSSIQNNQDNILRVQAYFLAQEGIELVRNYRDSLWLNNTEFSTGLTTGNFTVYLNSNNTVNLDPLGSDPEFLGGDLNLESSDDGTLLFTGNQLISPSESENKFRRVVSIQNLDQDNLDLIGLRNDEKNSDSAAYNPSAESKQVTSTVYFDDKEIAVTTILTNWKQGPL